jgi:hypothetical protein
MKESAPNGARKAAAKTAPRMGVSAPSTAAKITAIPATKREMTTAKRRSSRLGAMGQVDRTTTGVHLAGAPRQACSGVRSRIPLVAHGGAGKCASPCARTRHLLSDKLGNTCDTDRQKR